MNRICNQQDNKNKATNFQVSELKNESNTNTRKIDIEKELKTELKTDKIGIDQKQQELEEILDELQSHTENEKQLSQNTYIRLAKILQENYENYKHNKAKNFQDEIIEFMKRNGYVKLELK